MPDRASALRDPEKADQPDLLHFERSFGADLFAYIPGWPTFSGWVIL